MNAPLSGRDAFVLYTRLKDARGKSHTEISEKGMDLLSYALQKYAGTDIASLILRRTPRGKPYFENRPDLQFNISNSGDYIALILSPVEVGIDIQEKRVMDIQKLGKKLFSVEEYREFLTSEDRQDRFFRTWVEKESFVKWTGDGLLHGLRTLPLCGWHMFLLIDRHYCCAVRAGLPLNLTIEEVTI